MKLKLTLIAAAATASSLATTSEATRGLPPSMEPRYAAGTDFTCLDGLKTIPFSAINDDFCDCADGSDEPGTSACAAVNARFFCRNKGFRGKFIPASNVMDGICDCCDGSDEYATKKPCRNTCEEDGAGWRLQQAEAIKKAEEGARLRSQYAAEGKNALESRTSKVQTFATSLESLKGERTLAENSLQALEAEEARVNEARNAEASATLYTKVAEGLGVTGYTNAQLLSLLVDHVRDTGTSGALVKRLRRLAGEKEEEEPVATPSPDNAEEYVPADDDSAASDVDTLKPGSGGSSTGRSSYSALSKINWLEEFDAASTPYKSPAGDQAREKLIALRGEINKVEQDLRQAKEEGEKDFGPDNAFYPLRDKCYDLKVNQYTYHVCPFGTAKQDYTSLGTYEGWEKNPDTGAVDYTSMLFKNGQYCWNGPARSLRLKFICGTTDAVLSFDEPEKCTYAAFFSTPAVCDATHARELRLELDAGDDVAVAPGAKTEL